MVIVLGLSDLRMDLCLIRSAIRVVIGGLEMFVLMEG